MLLSLYIKDFILIDSLEIEFKKGLTSIIGDTGAGKSIILKALVFLMSKKTNLDLIKKGCDQASVVAEFDISSCLNISNYLNDHDYIESNQNTLLIKRIVSKDSRNRIYINDSPATVETLRKILNELCEICSQHTQVTLLDKNTHVGILDNYAGSNLADTEGAYQRLNTLQQKHLELSKQQQSNQYEIAYLKNTIEELTALDVNENEMQELSTKREGLQECSKILDAINPLTQKLSRADDSLISQLWAMHKSLIKFQNIFSEQGKKLESIITELDSTSAELENKVQTLVEDSQDIDSIETRFYKLKDAEKKYSTCSSKFKELIETSENRLETLERDKLDLESLEKEIDQCKSIYFSCARILSNERQKAAIRLRNEFLDISQSINMGQVDIKINIEQKEIITKQGLDVVEIFIKTNPDQDFYPIEKTASGGELSRLVLAFKILSNNAHHKGIIIFDEIDSGTSGVTSKMIAAKLKELSSEMQVILITHQPQIIDSSDHVLHVKKTLQSNRTKITASALTKEQIQNEILYMQSGERKLEPSTTTGFSRQ